MYVYWFACWLFTGICAAAAAAAGLAVRTSSACRVVRVLCAAYCCHLSNFSIFYAAAAYMIVDHN